MAHHVKPNDIRARNKWKLSSSNHITGHMKSYNIKARDKETYYFTKSY